MDTPQLFIGVDPGASGAFAALDGYSNVLGTVRMQPSARDTVRSLRAAFDDAVRGAKFLHFKQGDPGPVTVTVFIEDVNSMPGWGHTGPFAFGRFYGRAEGFFAAMGTDPVYVLPRVWQKALGLTDAPLPKGTKLTTDEKRARAFNRKQRLVDAAARLWPRATINSGIADALLIAEYGRRSCLNLQVEGTGERHGEKDREEDEAARTAQPAQAADREGAAGHGEYAPSAARPLRGKGRRDSTRAR